MSDKKLEVIKNLQQAEAIYVRIYKDAVCCV